MDEFIDNLEQATQQLFVMKQQACNLFMQSNYMGAIECLQLICNKFDEYSLKHNDLSNTNMFEIFLECHLNLGLCHIKLKSYEIAIGCFTSLLLYARNHSQAHYLRAKAAIKL
mmetsp:Transcript_54709/g.75170  ORF Transcript_54709/g.75170 Transcript_54709/m.75170 type:complete len:113 (+) Transcript_54709:370-708(+)